MEYREVIRSHYAAMADAQLLELWEERHGLTAEALDALHAELLSRNIAEQVLPLPDQDGLLLQNPAERFSPKQMKGYWNELLEMAGSGENPEWLVFRMKQKGLTEAEAAFMVDGLMSAVINKINEADSDRLGAFIRLCCGVAVIVIAMLARLGNGMYFIGLVTIALSIVQAAIADSKKSRLQKLHSRLDADSSPNENQES